MTERRSFARRYPPLIWVGGALAAVIFALPSALNLPQANPGQTLEYAPVPGAGNSAQSGGNFVGVGLGNAGAGAGSLNLPTPPPIPPPLPGALPSGAGLAPSTKQCVGSPPRQTEDPLAPPCVAYFTGDNGGATFRGVTANEIRTVFYLDSGTYAQSSQGAENANPGYYDLGQPAKSGEFVELRALRLWQQYFNARYQTYGRRVHFVVHVAADANSGSVEDRRADAADEAKTIQPIAAIPDTDASNGNVAEYLKAVNAHGSLGFGNPISAAQDYNSSPGYLWSFRPTADERARVLADYVCSKALPYPASFSGNPGENGKARRFGLLTLNDPSHPEISLLASDIETQLKRCGVQILLHQYGDNYTDSAPGDAQLAATNMANFKRQGITTIIRVLGPDFMHSTAGANLGYLPEWLVADDDSAIDANLNPSALQSQTSWSHAQMVTPRLLYGADQVEAPCADAIRSVSAQTPTADYGYYCYWYDQVRQYFTAIQVAGPRLNPSNLEQGMRAIPAHPSGTPLVPACFYDPGDFTCVKDAIAEWWDPSGIGDPGTNGCWRAVNEGRRSLYGEWSHQDMRADRSTHDPCNTYKTTFG